MHMTNNWVIFYGLLLIYIIHTALLVDTANAVPPKYVYRSDFRQPSDIFQNGFKALGNNSDLKDHVTGASCNTGSRNSAFVATSASKQFATDWGRDRSVINTDVPFVYVYTIRATTNFYDVYLSLLQKNESCEYQALASRYQYQQEWVALNGVRASQIQKVDVYKRPDRSGRMIFVRTLINQNYNDSDTHGNPNPFPIGGTSPTFIWRLRSALSYLTACFSLCIPESSTVHIVQDIASMFASTCPVPYKDPIVC